MYLLPSSSYTYAPNASEAKIGVPPTDLNAQKGNNDKFKKYFHGMLNEGIYLPPSAFESYFLNDALSYSDIDLTINALTKVLKSF